MDGPRTRTDAHLISLVISAQSVYSARLKRHTATGRLRARGARPSFQADGETRLLPFRFFEVAEPSNLIEGSTCVAWLSQRCTGSKRRSSCPNSVLSLSLILESAAEIVIE